MAELLNRLRTAMRSLGNDGALANVHSDITATAHAHQEVDRLERRLASALELSPASRAA